MKKSAMSIVVLFLLLGIPLIHPVQAQSGDEELICCDASELDLYLIGSQSNKKLTPFAQELGDEPQSTSVSTAISSQESIGTWTLDDVWAGTVPSSTWTFGIHYEITDAGGAQINATATITVGSKSFSAETQPGSFLSQGEGILEFEIEVESFSLSASNTIEIELTAQAIVFSVPTSDSTLKFLWGTEEFDSSLEATIPLLDIHLIEPEVGGKEVYIPISIDSPYGMSTLALSDSLELYVNGAIVSGDPIETGSGDRIRVTWTWLEASGGTENINIEVRLVFQPGRTAMTGSATVEVTTTDTGGGTGSYYPPDEPLRTNGVGSRLDVDIQIDMSSEGDDSILVEKTTVITMYDEMSFWVRWGLDHIGDDNPAHSSAIRAFSAGGVTDEDRVSRFIESVELGEFERQLVNLGTTYVTQGLGLESKELIGDFKEFDAIDISVDLNGETAVKPHPITLTFTTVETIPVGIEFQFEDFIVVQPAKVWSTLDLQLEISTSMMTGLTKTKLLESDALNVQSIRTPLSDTVILSGNGLEQDETFTLSTIPTASPIYSPFILAMLILVSFIGAYLIALKIAAYRQKKILTLELILMSISLFRVRRNSKWFKGLGSAK